MFDFHNHFLLNQSLLDRFSLGLNIPTKLQIHKYNRIIKFYCHAKCSELEFNHFPSSAFKVLSPVISDYFVNIHIHTII